MEVFYPVDLLKFEDWELEYLEDWMLSPVALLASENRSASASLTPPLSRLKKTSNKHENLKVYK